MTPMIHLSHLTKKFGSFTAVNDVSIDVEPGTIFAFLGTNGAGKTTSMPLIPWDLFLEFIEARVADYNAAALDWIHARLLDA